MEQNIDAKREKKMVSQMIVFFGAEGKYKSEWDISGYPCSLFIF